MVLSNLAALYSEMGDIDESIKLLKKALRVNPSFGNGWYNLALVEYQKNYPRDAVILCLRKAMKYGIPSDEEKKAIELIEYLKKANNNKHQAQNRNKSRSTLR